jgi:Delta7-sterol 5-desaturase
MDVVRDYLNDRVEELSPGTFLGMEYDNPLRVFLVLYVILYIGGFLSYFGITGIHYLLVYKLFPKQLLRPEDEPIQPGQIQQEIMISVRSMPYMVLLTAPIYWLQWCGYSRVYTNVDEYGWPYFFLSIALFLMFTDCGVYWIHRGLHWGPLYKYVVRVVVVVVRVVVEHRIVA